MEYEQLFHFYDKFNFTNKSLILNQKNNTLNPWTENDPLNPYLNNKTNNQKKLAQNNSLKNINFKPKTLSLQKPDLDKASSPCPKQNSQNKKISKELPKLNIGHITRHESLKKKKMSENFSKRNILNTSPLYFSSPALGKVISLHSSREITKKQRLLPAVSRELDITRKIYLIRNKFNSSISPGTKRKTDRNDGDIRRLVEKQWQKKQ